MVSKDATSISDLSRIILRDANLTARVLRDANSATYNVTGSTISTISRTFFIASIKKASIKTDLCAENAFKTFLANYNFD